MQKLKSMAQAIRFDFKKNKALLVMLLLPVALLIIFHYVPLYGITIAFKDYHPIQSIGESEWVGLKHFISFFQYKGLGTLLKNTLVLNLYSILLTPIPMIFALCINYLPFKRLKKFIQTVSIIPNFISIVIVCQLVMNFFSVDGAINFVLSLFGMEPINFLAQGELFSSIYAWSGIWQSCGYSAIVYIAALSNVSKTQHEAAVMDGANLFQRILFIDIPNILPLYAVNLVFQFGSLLNNNFEKVLLLQNNINLPYSQVISTYTYDIAFNNIIPQYSLSMAVGFVTAIVNLCMLLIVQKLVKKWEANNGE